MDDPILVEQQSSRVTQLPNEFNGEVANTDLSSQDTQFVMNEVRGDAFALGSNVTFPQDVNGPLPISSHQPQSTSHPITPPLSSEHAVNSQCEAPLEFTAHDVDGFYDWVDPMGWLLQDDYDLENFNQLLPGINNTQIDVSQPDRGNFRGPFTADAHTRRPRDDRSRPKIPDLRRCWYTQVSVTDALHGSVSRSMSPTADDHQSKDDIDESYRANAASKLLHKARNEPLPSLGLLNLFIHLFFTRFNVALPLIHGSTFRPTKENGLLVLSICSAGSLWFGSKEATNAGSMLFERVNKAILESPWERYLLRNPSSGLNTLKASLIGQTFGLLSGDPVHLETAGGYHGTVLSVARRLKAFDETSEVPLEANPSKSQLHEMWRKWARSEERRRLATCLYVHDAELSALFHHEPLLRHRSDCLPRLSSTELFNASSAEAWYSRLRAERGLGARLSTIAEQDASLAGGSVRGGTEMRVYVNKVTPSMLEILSILSGIGASISASRRLNTLTRECQAQYQAELLAWYESTAAASHKWASPEQGMFQVTLNILALWHYTWLALHVDLNVLELAIGREGPEVSQSTIDYIDSWVSSDDSLRCLLHAWLLQDCISRMPPGPVIALHIPRVLFSAAVIWYCFITYNPNNVSAAARNHQIDSRLSSYIQSLPELHIMTHEREESRLWAGAFPEAIGSRLINNNISRLQETLGAVLTQMKQQTLYTLADLLRRSNSYGIASRMADIIEIMLSHGMDVAVESNSDLGGIHSPAAPNNPNPGA